jgi:hypothetical protein
MSRAALIPLVALALALALASSQRDARAHSRPMSYSFWTLRADHAEVRVQISTEDLALLGFDVASGPLGSEQAGKALQTLVTLERDAVACKATTAPLRLPSSAAWVLFRWELQCGGGAQRISVKFVSLLESGHRHLVRLESGNGPALERVLELGHATWDVGGGGSTGGRRGSSLLDYVRLGIEHLLTGWDHLAFVFALLLLAPRFRDVVGLVTSFTVAHSLTLALSVLSIVKADAAATEALIAFSIALLGAENGWLLSGRPRAVPVVGAAAFAALLSFGGGAVGRVTLFGLFVFCACHFALLLRAKEPANLRIAVAFAFGLIHGFGFAGAMAEMDLPRARLVSALFGFNIGVEVGQLAVVGAAWPLLRALHGARGESRYPFFSEAASAAICGLGLFWFIVRSFGISS